MRRKDREMDEEFALQVIDKANYCVMSMVDIEGVPYGIPISYARLGNVIFIHSAKQGKKVDILRTNNFVSVTCVGEVEVPHLYTDEELDVLVKQSKSVLGSKVYTTQFESAIFHGKLELVKDNEIKKKGLRLLCEKYTPDSLKYFDQAMEASLAVTDVYQLEMKGITAKRKRFDSHGEEMKYGRVE